VSLIGKELMIGVLVKLKDKKSDNGKVYDSVTVLEYFNLDGKTELEIKTGTNNGTIDK
jgi:hypothetical protein